MTTVLFVIGVVLLLLLLVDVHMTVFVPRGGSGPVSRRVYRGLWMVWHALGNRLFEGERRRVWLAQIGPALVPLTVLTWGVLLIGAFALIYTPWVEGFSISPTESGPMPDWAMVLYYSGYSAVTLGVGDIVPNGTIPRLLVVIEAGLGFALFTASISYLLSVYSARNLATTLALAVSDLVGSGDRRDPANLLAETVASEAAQNLDTWMTQLSLEVAALVEMSGQYPLLRYFHEPDDARAIPMAMRDLLELTSVCRALLDPQTSPELARGPSGRALYQLGTKLLREGGSWESSDPAGVDERRRERYEAARRRLAEAGVSLRPDEDAWPAFRELVAEWDLLDEGMREALGYPSDAA